MRKENRLSGDKWIVNLVFCLKRRNSRVKAIKDDKDKVRRKVKFRVQCATGVNPSVI